MKLLSVLALVVATLMSETIEAASRRAVIVGIDQYTIPGVQPRPRGKDASPLQWRDLKGAVNDATRIEQLLIARFGFAADDILVLQNQEATHEAIVEAIKENLVDADGTTPGDLRFFYFAGHGSRVRNSLSKEGDKLDESIVPADAARGVLDVRDKQLRDLFNTVIDKGDQLVAVFDSCHSGSVTRGPAGPPEDPVRMLPFDARDVRDSSEGPNPWARGAVVFSAAQQDQLAHEGTDEHGIKGGVFTIALARALRTASPREPAQDLFRRVKALIKAEGKSQEPVLEATAARKTQPLFGDAGERHTGRTVAAVQSVSAARIILQEGIAAGLTEQTELVRVGETNPRIRITKVAGLVSSYAEVVNGDPGEVEVGDLFVVDRWAPPTAPSLRVWVPESGWSSEALQRFAEGFAAEAEESAFVWVDDPSEEVPTHTIYFDSGAWQLAMPTGEVVALGRDLTPGEIGNRVKGEARLFVSLPATQNLHKELRFAAGSENSAVEPVADRASAHYHLMGRSVEGQIEYAWVRPWLAADSTTTLPARTDWIVVKEPVGPTARRLEELTVRLGRIRAWLTLEGPPNTRRFPYTLALKRTDSNRVVTEGTLREGESFEFVLLHNRARVRRGESQYVYVFAIDGKGKSTLLFPRGGAVENRFPPEEDSTAVKEYHILPESEFEVSEPFGLDTFIMIVTGEQLPDPTVLNSEGVVTRGPTRQGTALQDLLANVGVRTRGQRARPVPTSWSIERMSVESAARVSTAP